MINFATTTKIFSNFIIILFGIFLFIKIVVPLLKDYFFERFRPLSKKKSPSIDQLISRQELILRKGQLSPQKSSLNKVSSLFNQRLLELSQMKSKSKPQELEYKSLKQAIDLFDQLDWGSNKRSEKIQDSLNRKLNFSFSQKSIHDAVKILENIHEKDIQLFSRPPYFQALDEIVKSIVLLTTLRKSSSLERSLLKKDGRSEIVTYIFLERKSNTKIPYSLFRKYVLEKKKVNQNIIEPQLLKHLIIKHQKEGLSFNSLVENLKRDALLIEKLIPVELAGQKPSLKSCLKLLNLSTLPSYQSLQKSYKLMISIHHPDKITPLVEGEEFQKPMLKTFVDSEQDPRYMDVSIDAEYEVNSYRHRHSHRPAGRLTGRHIHRYMHSYVAFMTLSTCICLPASWVC